MSGWCGTGRITCQSAGDEHRHRELTRDRPIPARHVYTVKRQPLACIKPVCGRLPNHEGPELITCELGAFGVTRVGGADQRDRQIDPYAGVDGGLTADKGVFLAVSERTGLRFEPLAVAAGRRNPTWNRS